jgi:hypothetical protein
MKRFKEILRLLGAALALGVAALSVAVPARAACGDDPFADTCDPECGGSSTNPGCADDPCGDPFEASCLSECGGDSANPGCPDDPCADPFEASCLPQCGGSTGNPGCENDPCGDPFVATCLPECGGANTNPGCPCADPFVATCLPECNGDICNPGCGGTLLDGCQCDPCDPNGLCPDPFDPSCENCGQPPGETGECCNGSWCSDANGATCMNRDVCSGESCSGSDPVCAVAIVHSCNDDADCCDVCDAGGGCYAGPENCPPVDECTYDVPWEVTLECHGEETTYNGVATKVYPVPCPTAEQAQSQVEAEKAQELAAEHPCPLCPSGQEECDGACIEEGGLCCTEGTFECDGQCVEDGSLCCGGDEQECNGQCIPSTDTCGDVCDACGGPEPTCCPNAELPEDVCIESDECCNPEYVYCPYTEVCLAPEESDSCCPPDTTYCDITGECVPNDDYEDVCTAGCYGFQQVSSYCTTIIKQDGTVAPPWATRLPTEAARQAYFTGNLNQEITDQADARNDGLLATPYYPIYGRVAQDALGQQCTGSVCQHGEECLLSVTTGGKSVATCVDIECDPCQVGSACYDEDQCICDPETEVCCEPGEPGCVMPRRAVMIEVFGKRGSVIDPGQSCLVLWATLGMASTTLAGEGVDAEVRHLFGGVTLVEPSTSAIYKILGTGIDGLSYEAVDLCAMNPAIIEV